MTSDNEPPADAQREAVGNAADKYRGESECYATSNGPRTAQEFLDHYADIFRNFTMNGLVQVWGAPVGIEALRDSALTFSADQALRDLSGLGRPGTPPSPEGYEGWRKWYETQP